MGSDACAIYAPIIAVVVSFLKRVPFIARYPKVIAFVLSFVANGFTAFATGGAVHTAQLVQCVLTSFAGAIATYEVAIAPVAKATGSQASGNA